jgi:hypothetical protein
MKQNSSKHKTDTKKSTFHIYKRPNQSNQLCYLPTMPNLNQADEGALGHDVDNFVLDIFRGVSREIIEEVVRRRVSPSPNNVDRDASSEFRHHAQSIRRRGLREDTEQEGRVMDAAAAAAAAAAGGGGGGPVAQGYAGGMCYYD